MMCGIAQKVLQDKSYFERGIPKFGQNQRVAPSFGYNAKGHPFMAKRGGP